MQALELSKPLYRWQQEALEFFIKNHKAIYNVTTGGGKTRLACEIIHYIRLIEDKPKILIVVPKNVILEQTWYKQLYDNGIPLPEIGVWYGDIKEYSENRFGQIQGNTFR
jgi:superfamily II DNA or RNA helicase